MKKEVRMREGENAPLVQRFAPKTLSFSYPLLCSLEITSAAAEIASGNGGAHNATKP